MKWLRIFFWCSIVLLSAGCKQEQKESGKLTIVCTTGMVADAVKNITGDKAEVITLMGPGVDPHLYKATQGDLQRLQESDIIVYNGLHLEGKMSEVLEKMSSSKPIIAMGNGVSDGKLRSLGNNVHDPHIWFDVAIWKQGVTFLTSQLSSADSTNKKMYEQNLVSYAQQLDSLDVFVKRQIQTIPESQRVLITAHDAFGYFGAAYSMEVRGLQGLSTVSDYGLNDVTNLVDFIVNRKIKAIFVETSVSEKSIEAVMQGCKSKGHEVKIGGSLYSDAMGAAGSKEGTYLGMVRKNVETIVNALR
jgi:manganese/zinc/iron transport system substrate-binding protein